MAAELSGPDPSAAGPRRSVADVLLLRHPATQIVVLWLCLGSVLGLFAGRVRDYMDFDAGRYERLAISIAQTGNPLPRINGVDIHYVSMLYPWLLAPFFTGGALWHDLVNAQIASAYIMSSACIPAFLLTRRVTAARWAPWFVAVFTVCTPWIVFSLSLMTEVASYPASVWAVYAMVVALSAPSRTHDLLALVAMAAAFLARGELITLVFVLPVALVVFELGRAAGDGGVRGRAAVAGRAIVRDHSVIVAVYAALATIAVVLEAVGRLSSTIGIYSVYSDAGHLAWSRLPRSLVEHVATFSLGVGVVPCVVALAWFALNVFSSRQGRDAHAFACVGALTVLVIFVQATNFDLVVNAYIHDRFLLYFVPLMLVGAVLGVAEAQRLRWLLVPSLALVAGGFAVGEIPPVTWSQFPWLDLDTPVSTVYRVLAHHLGGLTAVRVLLGAIAVAGAGVVAAAGAKVRTTHVALVVFGWAAVAMAFSTEWTFVRAFDSIDRNGRSLTDRLHGTLDWIDESVGSGATVTAIQSPVSSDWFVSEKAWVDYKYFNKSLVRDGRVAGSDPFDYTGFWFPKLDLHFDPVTGAVAESPTRWVAESVNETRFRISGPARFTEQNVMLIDAGRPWRLDWRTFGLYDDGWTRPGVPMRVRLYAFAGQATPRSRGLTLIMRAPDDVAHRSVTVQVQGATKHAVVTPSATTVPMQVCVPARGYAEVRLSVAGSSSIPGDLATLAASELPRRGGVAVASIGEADEIGPTCSVPAATG